MVGVIGEARFVSVYTAVLLLYLIGQAGRFLV
jgi:hypothetical protein